MFLRGRPVPMLIPDELAPSYSLDTRSELPSRRLKLDWVYPFALISSSHSSQPTRLPPPPPPAWKGPEPFWCGTSAGGRVFVLKVGLSRPLWL